MYKIFIATTSFSIESNDPIDELKSHNFQIGKNNTGRKLNSNELIKALDKFDGVIAGTEAYTKEVLNKLPQLKVISRLGIGMDNIDINQAQQNGKKIFKTDTTPGPAVAELALGLILDVARKISYQNNVIKSGKWKKHMGNLLYGKTLGIIGLGSIGKNLIRLTNGFNFQILAFDSYHDEKFALENNVKYCDLDSLLANSDLISIHLNLTNETHKILNPYKLSKLKSLEPVPRAFIKVTISLEDIIFERAFVD